MEKAQRWCCSAQQTVTHIFLPGFKCRIFWSKRTKGHLTCFCECFFLGKKISSILHCLLILYVQNGKKQNKKESYWKSAPCWDNRNAPAGHKDSLACHPTSLSLLSLSLSWGGENSFPLKTYHHSWGKSKGITRNWKWQPAIGKPARN